MAARSSSDSRPSLSVASLNQIPKDAQGFDNSIPLSPQWLLPKPGESKPGVGTGENLPSSNLGNRPDNLKAAGNGEEVHDVPKKKDVFRPSSMMDMESGRNDRWRDEERDTNSSVRKDRHRTWEGEKELGDNRRNDRWTENSSTRLYGDQRRAPTERWTDNSNKDSNYEQRRENKWNSRWGPGDKEAEKWMDPGKDSNLNIDKRPSLVSNHGKEEREGDTFRPWRASSALGRGRGEPSSNQTPSNKPVHGHSYNRGRGENTSYSFSAGRGRVSSGGNAVNNNNYSHPPTIGSFSDKAESGHGDPMQLRYSRMELIDVYRSADLRASRRLGEGFVDVPSLTMNEAVEPLALCQLNSEELAVIKGIDKGDILSSGAPPISKEGRGQGDSMQSRRTNLGSRDDHAYEDSKDDGADCVKAYREDGGSFRKADEPPTSRESNLLSMPENSSSHPGSMWKGQSTREPVVYQDCKETPNDIKLRTPESGWSHLQKNLNSEWESNMADPQLNKDAVMRRQLSGAWDREQEARKTLQPSPEDLQFCYVDPQGVIQGPFAGADIVGWFEAGYFGIDLQVRLANASNDVPFTSLGDAMPHLKAKARPPPGFAGPKQNEISEAVSRMNVGGFNKPHVGLNDTNLARNESRHIQGSTTEAENKYLESLMAGNNMGSSAFTEGLQVYVGNNSQYLQPAGVDNLLAKRMALERQQSLTNPYGYWPGMSKVDMTPDQKILPPMTDNSSQPQPQPQPQPHPQSADIMSVLQGLSDRSSSGLNSNSVGGWPNFNVQGGPDVLSKMGLHDQTLGLQSPFGIQHQRPPQLQNQTSGTQGVSMPGQLLSPNLAQDSQLLNMMQQQFMLLNSQSPSPAQQRMLLEKMLLIQQQQKQEEQQMLLLRQQQQQQHQQQQQLLSQVLSDHQNRQQFGDLSFGQLQIPAMPTSNASLDPRFQAFQEVFPAGSNMPVPSVQNERPSNVLNLPSQVNQDNHYGASSEASFHLPHQVFDGPAHQKSWGSTVAEQGSDVREESLPKSVENLSISGPNKSAEELHVQKSISVPGSLEAETLELSGKVGSEAAEFPGVLGSAPLLDVKEPSDTSAAEQKAGSDILYSESSTVAEVKNVELREQRKASEKKSKKQRSSKSQSSDQTKESLKTTLMQTEVVSEDAAYGSKKSGDNKSRIADADVADTEPLCIESDSKTAGSAFTQNIQAQAVRAWKPAPGFKAKSLLEIQQEEQKKAQMEVVSEIAPAVSSSSFTTPWAGIVANSDPKFREILRDGVADSNTGKTEISLSPKVKKSQLSDLLVEEVSAASIERDIDVPVSAPIVPSPKVTPSPSASVDDDNFIDAKETKKSRKKSAKAKASGSKASVLATPVDVPISPSPAKSSRSVQLEKEVLPAIPSGPSLSDYVVWKGESANSSPAPAWSTDSGKVPKAATSLRDILKQEERKSSTAQYTNQIPIPQKPQPSQPVRGSGSLWSHTGSSPSKAASPIQTKLTASQVKQKEEDEFFWGATGPSKQETNRTDFPNLSSQGSWGTKSNPSKGTSVGTLSRQKSSNAERILSSSPGTLHSSFKGKNDATSKRADARAFRDMCEGELLRLVGSKDTNILEYCLKQSRSEAEVLLVENLGSYDSDHKFIEKFLNYMELMPKDVLEMAFQGQNDQSATGFSAGDVTSDRANFGDGRERDAPEGSSSKGGKKKGKKGKKMSSSAVLGFNVVSNRIMMGEIQSVDD